MGGLVLPHQVHYYEINPFGNIDFEEDVVSDQFVADFIDGVVEFDEFLQGLDLIRVFEDIRVGVLVLPLLIFSFVVLAL